jgi:Tfp pilus assembly protein PilV
LHQQPVMARADAGFTLIDTLIATAITIVAVAALAELVVISSAANGHAKATTIATILAQDKFEELLVSDGDDQGADFFDGRGGWIASGSAPAAWGYTRRWSAQRLSPGSSSIVISVMVSRAGAAGEAASVVGVRRRDSGR